MKTNKKTRYSFPAHNFMFLPGTKEHFKIKDFIMPADWIEQHFELSSAYAVKGRVTLFVWQRDVVNSVVWYTTLIIIAAVQTGKSMLCEGILGFKVDTSNTNIMAIYAKRETVQDVFDERLKPLIQEVPALRKYWSGRDDDLTKRKIKLSHLVIRVAAAGVKADIASHNAGVMYGSELAKWPKKDFSQTRAVEGRKQASRMMGEETLTIYETSPETDQDKSHEEAHKGNTIIFKPHYPCPHCDEFQVLVDSQVKEIPNKKGVKDHNVNRILTEEAAYYECIHCREKITQDMRYEMSLNMKWLDKSKKYTPETGRHVSKRACFQWSRFVDVTWTFWDCLAAYFEAYHSKEPEALKTYRNEDMGDWVKVTSNRIDDHYLRSKCRKYRQYGDTAFCPDGVRIILCSLDTQDNGFYYVIRGYGEGMETWLIRSDFIPCDMKEEKYKNRAEVNEHVFRELKRNKIQKVNGKEMKIFSFIFDRGGHRAGDIDYMVSHNPNVFAYTGSTRAMGNIVEEKASGLIYGNTKMLSRIVAKMIESKIWHLPYDINKEYLEQVLNQYDEEYVDSRGNTKTRWVKGDEIGKPDHLRDCENMNIALFNLLDLETELFEENAAEQLEVMANSNDDVDNAQDESRERYQESPSSFQNFKSELNGIGW